MADEGECPTCGRRVARSVGNVIFFRSPQGAGPPRIDALELPDGRYRLTINLVVSRAAAVRVLASLQDSE